MANEYECPHCGAPIKLQQRKCEYCKSELFVSSIAYLAGCNATDIQKYIALYKNILSTDAQSIEGHIGLGLCYLQLNMYPLAKKEFDIVIKFAPENALAYYYLVLSTIAGRRVKNIAFDEIEQMITYLETARSLDLSNDLFSLLEAVVKHDFYVINCLREPSPTHQELFEHVSFKNINENEIVRIKNSVKIKNWAQFNIG